MLIVEITRPNSIGVTFTQEYASYAEAEEFIERRCERLANQGWELTESQHSTSKYGCIEGTHDEAADIVLIQWRTINDDVQELDE